METRSLQPQNTLQMQSPSLMDTSFSQPVPGQSQDLEINPASTGFLMHLKDCLAENYRAVHDLAVLKGGIENDSFRVQFTDGFEAVARIYRNKTKSQVEAEANFLRLIQQDVRCAPFIESASGDIIPMIDGRPFSLTKFLPGNHIAREEFTREMFFQLGKYLSITHKLTQGNCLRHFWGITEVVQKGQSLLNMFSGCQTYRELRDLIAGELDILQKMRHQDLSMIHADLDVGNLLSDQDGVLWLIDWDDCGYAPAALDIAIAIRNLVVKRIARNPELPGIKLEDACVAIAAGYGKPVENLGTWLRAACFRHAVLMLDSSFCNPQYPSRNDDNFRMLNIARQVEQSLNQL